MTGKSNTQQVKPEVAAALEALAHDQRVVVEGFLVSVLSSRPGGVLALVASREYGKIRVFLPQQSARRGSIRFEGKVSRSGKGLFFVADPPRPTEAMALREGMASLPLSERRARSLGISELPASDAALAGYLADMVPGVGQAGAERMIRAYHGAAGLMRALVSVPASVIAAEGGMTRSRADSMKRIWMQSPGSHAAKVALRTLGLNRTQVERALELALRNTVPKETVPGDDEYMRAALRICNHPYRLTIVDGVGFPTADQAALGLGVSEDSRERATAALRHALLEAADEGHTMLWVPEACERTARLLSRQPQNGEAPAPPRWMDVARDAIRSVDEKTESILFPTNTREGLVPIALSRYVRAEAESAIRMAKIFNTPAKPVPIPDMAQMRAQLGLTPNEQQIRAIQTGLANKISLITGDPGTGKAQPVDEPVLVPARGGKHSWKPIGAMKPGDKIVDPYGEISEVDSIHPQGVKPIVKVTMQGGRSTRATLDHLWLVRTTGVQRVVTTQQILNFQREGAAVELPMWNGDKGLQWLALDSIEPCGTARCICIRLTSSSSLYITSDFLVTHNTTITKGLCKSFTAAKQRILLVAPTGRAAKRMREATGLEAQTVQSIVAQGRYSAPAVLADYDVLIGDEWGMTDTVLNADLLRLMPDRMRLLLVGDPYQLPSVGAGAVISDLIESGVIPCVKLVASQRIGDDHPVYAFARGIKNGDDRIPVAVEGRLGIEKTADDDESMRLILDRVNGLLHDGVQLDQIVVISSIRGGRLGVGALNARLQDLINPVRERRDLEIGRDLPDLPVYVSPGDRVIQDKPDRDLGLVNGDVGYITHVDRARKMARVDFGGGEIEIRGRKLNALRLNYASTVHKSQGAEYKHVIITLSPAHTRMMRRNLLYTAVTRGKECVDLVGDPNLIRVAIQNEADSQRHTMFRALLQAEFGKYSNLREIEELDLAFEAHRA